jgi:Flp pilus assembly protein TadG
MSIRKPSERRDALLQWSLAKLKAFNGDRSGTVAIIFAVSAIAIVALLGAAFDISRALGDKSKIQSALDQAVFAAAQAAPKDREAVAQRLFLINTQGLGTHVTTPIITTSGGTVTGTTTGTTTTAVPALPLSPRHRHRPPR